MLRSGQKVPCEISETGRDEELRVLAEGLPPALRWELVLAQADPKQYIAQVIHQ